MTLANALTLFRGVLIAPTTAAVLLGRPRIAFACFALAGLTDAVDGLVARTRHEVTFTGAMLDPAMDKLLYMALFSALAATGKLPILGPVLYAIPQLGLGIGALALWRRRREFAARWPGKAAAALTALAVACLLLTPWGEIPFWIAIAANFLSALYYLFQQTNRKTRLEEAPQTPSTSPSQDGETPTAKRGA